MDPSIRATDEGSLPEIAQYSPYYLPLIFYCFQRIKSLYFILYGPRCPLVNTRSKKRIYENDIFILYPLKPNGVHCKSGYIDMLFFLFVFQNLDCWY